MSKFYNRNNKYAHPYRRPDAAAVPTNTTLDNSKKEPLPVDMSSILSQNKRFQCPHCSKNVSEGNLFVRKNDVRDIRIVNYESEGEDQPYPSSRVLAKPVCCNACRGPFRLSTTYQQMATIFREAAEKYNAMAIEFTRNEIKN